MSQSHKKAAADRSGAIERAVQVLSSGGLVAFPTDTYYGIGCDLFDKRAIERIYQFITPIATVSPGVLDILDHDENVRAACDVLGMPVKGVREDKVVKKIRADRGAAEADAAQVDADRQDAGTVKDLAAAENKNPQGAPFPPGIPGTEVGSFGGESPQA